MKIKEHLSVYLESGYLFDDMSGKLKWFEIDKILISFTYGVVRYVGTWGGCRTEKTLDGKLFYSSEECFKRVRDGFVDTTGIVTSIKSKNVVEFYVENPFVKIKDE